MRTNLPHQPYKRPSPYRGLGRMLLASIVVHLVVFIIFGGGFLPRKTYKRPPAIRVNLANMPVANPQAGRLDAVKGAKKDKQLAARAKAKPKPKKKPKAKPTVKIPEPKKPEPKKPEPEKPEPKKPEPKKVEPKKPEPKKTVVAKKKPKPKPKPKGPTPEEVRAKKLENLRKKRQREAERLEALDAEKARDNRIKALKDKLAALSTNAAARDQGSSAPVGDEKGTGTEEGPSDIAWLQEFYRSQWKLSKYQISRTDLQAVIKVTFAANGSLADYTFVEESGDPVFDASLRATILKVREYPRPLTKKTVFDLVFNLKDLQE